MTGTLFSVRGSTATMAGGIFLLIGLGLLIFAIAQFSADRRFAREAHSTQGAILTKVIRVSTSGSGTDRTRTRHYEATYRFAVDGTTIEGRDELTRDGWEGLTEGGRADVLYLPTDPSSSRLGGPRPWSLRFVFGPVGLVLTVVGAVLVARGRRDAALESRLQQSGVTTKGTVTQLQPTRFRLNDEQRWRLEYEYQDAAGHRHVNVHDLPEDEAELWRTGEIGIVRYDPGKPTGAVWLGRQ